MSIESAGSGKFWLSNVSHCFLCGEPLHGVFVFWAGATCNIGLHEDCATDLAAHFLKDSACVRLGDLPEGVRHDD